jgi:AcrR family transcriptional regulator
MSIGYNQRMSPAPARTSRDAILAAARAILEEDGLDAVVMSRVAERVGVRGPSLYKHVANRAALIRGVADAVTADLGSVLARSVSTEDPRRDLIAAVLAYRAFVQANPNGYGLLFAHLAPELQPEPTNLADIGLPLVDAMVRLVGKKRALEAARTLTAWAHGFVTMELAGAFRLGGDLDAAYRYGIEAILDGVSERATPGRGSRRRG